MIAHPLATILEEAAFGRFPRQDGSLVFLPAPEPYRGAVVAFTAHSFIATDVDSDELTVQLPSDDFGAPVSAPFLAWLGQRIQTAPGVLDAVLVHFGGGDGVGLPLVPRDDLAEHPRVARARGQRSDVQVFSDPDKRGLVTLGRGLVGRWEISLEIHEVARGAGLGRAMLVAARARVPAGQLIFAQVSPGNARSLRAFLAAGFRPIGSEVLFH